MTDCGGTHGYKNLDEINHQIFSFSHLTKVHVDWSVELVALDTFLTSLAPDQLTGLCPDPVTLCLLTADRLDRVLTDSLMYHGAGDNTLALPSLPPECLALITS